MDSQDILKALNRLEQNLQNVESARQQVINTVNAYEGAKTQLSALTAEFTQLSTELKNVYSAINENIGAVDDTLKTKFDNIFDDFSAKVKTFEDAACKLQSSFESSCRKTSQMFSGSIDENMLKFSGELDKCIATFNEKARHEIEGVTTAVTKFKLAVGEMQMEFRQSLSNVTEHNKNKQEEIATDFSKSIQKHVSSFSSLREELASIVKQYAETSKTVTEKIDNLVKLVSGGSTRLQKFQDAHDKAYKDLVSKIKSLEEGNIKAANSLSKRLDTIASQLCAISQCTVDIKKEVENASTQIISNLTEKQVKTESKLLSKIESLHAEVSVSKKFSLVCLVLLAISILINLIAVIK